MCSLQRQRPAEAPMGEGGEEELRWWWEGSRERRSYATRGARTTERPVEWILGRRKPERDGCDTCWCCTAVRTGVGSGAREG